MLSRIKRYNVKVTVDSALVSPTRGIYPVDFLSSLTTPVEVNQFKLIHAIGSIQSRRFSPSKKQKFIDKEDLIEKIKSDRDFKVKIDEIRSGLGSETLGKISKDFGVGIAVIVADYLYDLEISTLARISKHGKRPDIKCLTKAGEEIVIESKGYSSASGLRQQIPNALTQKASISSDIHAVSLTLIKEDSITTNNFIDPPSNSNKREIELERGILRTRHYSTIFSFIGQSELSKYFSYLNNRLEEKEDLNIIDKEIDLSNKIRKDNVPIVINKNKFLGTVEKVDQNRYIFLGVAEELLSYEGFLNFKEYNSDLEYEDSNSGNFFYIYRDGICVGDIRNLNPFPLEQEVVQYHERTTILDIDEMNGISFQKYIKYLFDKNGFNGLVNNNNADMGYDLIVKKNEGTFFIEIELSTKPLQNYQFDKNQLEQNLILITNNRVKDDDKKKFNNIIVLDRKKLRTITRNNALLSKYILSKYD